jgi:PAS domain-containing protein
MVDDQNDTWMSFQDESGTSGNEPEQETEQQERLQPAVPPETAGFQTRSPAEKTEAPGGGYLLTDEYGQIEYCDPRAAALLHTSAPRIVNRILAMVIPAELHQEIAEHRPVLLRNDLHQVLLDLVGILLPDMLRVSKTESA